MSAVLAEAKPLHVCVSVPDRDRAIAFWTEIFGFEEKKRFDIGGIGARGAFLKSAGLELELFEVAGSEPVPESRKAPNSDLLVQGTKHLAFRVPDVRAALKAVVARGVEVAAVQPSFDRPMAPETDPSGDGPAVAAFIHDPFGTLIELVGPEAD